MPRDTVFRLHPSAERARPYVRAHRSDCGLPTAPSRLHAQPRRRQDLAFERSTEHADRSAEILPSWSWQNMGRKEASSSMASLCLHAPVSQQQWCQLVAHTASAESDLKQTVDALLDHRIPIAPWAGRKWLRQLVRTGQPDTARHLLRHIPVEHWPNDAGFWSRWASVQMAGADINALVSVLVFARRAQVHLSDDVCHRVADRLLCQGASTREVVDPPPTISPLLFARRRHRFWLTQQRNKPVHRLLVEQLLAGCIERHDAPGVEALLRFAHKHQPGHLLRFTPQAIATYIQHAPHARLRAMLSLFAPGVASY